VSPGPAPRRAPAAPAGVSPGPLAPARRRAARGRPPPPRTPRRAGRRRPPASRGERPVAQEASAGELVPVGLHPRRLASSRSSAGPTPSRTRARLTSARRWASSRCSEANRAATRARHTLDGGGQHVDGELAPGSLQPGRRRADLPVGQRHAGPALPATSKVCDSSTPRSTSVAPASVRRRPTIRSRVGLAGRRCCAVRWRPCAAPGRGARAGPPHRARPHSGPAPRRRQPWGRARRPAPPRGQAEQQHRSVRIHIEDLLVRAGTRRARAHGARLLRARRRPPRQV
jgi:hypothetical protein